MEKERVPLAIIYKEEGIIHLELPNYKDVKPYELAGFLRAYLKGLEKELSEGIKDDQ